MGAPGEGGIEAAYERVWQFPAPRRCVEMHAAGLFGRDPARALDLTGFDVYDAETIAEGDVFVTDELVAGLVPIGGDRSGDRWCFDTRLRVGGTIPVLHCPHDGGGGVYVAPSFAGFVFRLVSERLTETRAPRAGTNASIIGENAAKAGPFWLRRWARTLRLAATEAPLTTVDWEVWLRRDPAFARLPAGEHDVFR